MKKLAIVFLLSLILVACVQQYDIEADVKGLTNDTLTVDYLFLSQPLDLLTATRDTVYAENSKFSFDVPGDEAVLLLIDPQMGRLQEIDGGLYRNFYKFISILFKPGDKIAIQGEVKELYTNFNAKGSTVNEQNSLLRQEYIEEVAESERITLQIDSLSRTRGNDELINELYQRRRQIYFIETNKRIEYIKNNLESELSAYYLCFQFSDTVAKYYPLLAEKLKNGDFKLWLEEKLESYQWEQEIIEAKSKNQEGAIAIDFRLESLDGSFVSLSDVKREYVVIDFWGSWCGPCVAGFPKMKEYFTKYGHRIEFIGIACYDTDENWKQSVAEHGVNWVQLINGEKTANDASLKYGVRNFPTKFILDKDRIILSRSKGEAGEFYDKLDELMSQK